MCRQESRESLSSDHSGSGGREDSDDQWLSQVIMIRVAQNEEILEKCGSLCELVFLLV